MFRMYYTSSASTVYYPRRNGFIHEEMALAQPGRVGETLKSACLKWERRAVYERTRRPIGVPSVLPNSVPDRILTWSASLRAVVNLDCPVRVIK